MREDEEISGSKLATTTAPTLATRQASSTQATREMALVHARCVMAERRPRNMNDVRVKMLELCKDPEFADAARYVLKFSGADPVKGLSIRFVEEMTRAMGNIEVSDDVVSDDDESTTIKSTAVDYETMASWSTTITVYKRMERRSVKDLSVVLSTRKNSYGDTLYIVPADEGAHRMKLNAEKSKAARTIGLRLIPGAILNECKRQIEQTMLDTAKRDLRDSPEATKKKIVDAFFVRFKLKPSELERLIQKPIEQAQERDIVLLRDVFAGMQAGELIWADAIASVEAVAPEDTEATKRKSEAAEKIRAVASKRVKKEPKGEPAKESKPAAAAPSSDEPPADWEPGSDG